MTVANYSSRYTTFLKTLCLLILAAMTGCVHSVVGRCVVGREVVITSSDTTAPTVVLDFHLPNGQIVSASLNSAPSTVTVPGGGKVTLIANASDDQGAKDVQLWIGTKTCSVNAGTTTCSGPGLLGAPTANNGDTLTAGQTGCTERLVSHNLEVRNTPSGSLSHEVEVRGLNFSGTEVRIPLIRLVAQ